MIPELVQRGIAKGYVSVSADNKRITYEADAKSYKFNNPEELVRAACYIELIEKYQYQPSRIGLEVAVPGRTPSDSADIVIYQDDHHRKPYILVECKRDGIADAQFARTIEKVLGNSKSLRAEFAAVIAGSTRRCFDVNRLPLSEPHRNIIADIPVNYGKVQEFRFKRGDPHWDIEPVNKEQLIRVLEKCHQTLWEGGRMAPTDSFDELSKIIFVKIRDEQIARKQGEPYDFQIKTNESPDSVHQRITGCYNDAKQIDPDVFTDNIQSPAEKLFAVVNHLQGINLSKTDLDTKGVAFERLMEDFFKGKQGQYFTPREVVKFIVEACDLDNTAKVLDPACGSGGFLLYALDAMREKAGEYFDDDSVEYHRYWHDFAVNNLYGIEVNERIARVAKMNMVIHDGHTNVICHDSLEDLAKIQQTNSAFSKDHFDLILTNPPFGAIVKQEEKTYLKQYQLGKNSSGKLRKSQKTEILFIERCWEFLKPGTGHLAIILPDGILTNKTLKYVRDFLLEKFELKAIFSLPQVTFAHYGAGLKSSVLLLRKKGEGEPATDYPVFAALAGDVGYDGTGRKSTSDLRRINQSYQAYREGASFDTHDIFVKQISQFDNNRLDPYYYSPLFEEILAELSRSPYPLRQLKEVCVRGGVFSGKTPAKDDYSENSSDPKIVKVATLKVGKVDLDFVEFVQPHAASKKTIDDGDILILSAAHQADYLGRNPCIVSIPAELSDQQITFVGELINIRVNQEIINPYYLLQLFNTRNYYLLINREKRGQTSHLYPQDLEKIKIPVPANMAIQDENAMAYQQRYEQYEAHLQRANQLLDEVYRDFEQQFLAPKID